MTENTTTGNSVKNRGTTANLKPFKKGQSGNPSGRPKLPDCLKKNATKAANELVLLLASSDENIRLKAAEKILDRVYGKPNQALELSGDQNNPINLQFVDIPPHETREQWLARVAKEQADRIK